MNPTHHYAVSVDWEGNRGGGTTSYRDYGRQHSIRVEGKPTIPGSADKPFRGDADRWNPEEMLLAALAQCHMLSYLHVAVMNGVVVTDYHDDAVGTMQQTNDGGGAFTSVTLRPVVTVADAAQQDLALTLHRRASELCFIASSVNFPVGHEARIVVSDAREAEPA